MIHRYVNMLMLALLCFAFDSRARVFGKAPETCPELVSLLAGATSDRAHALLAGVDGAHTSGASKDFGAGIQVFIERFIESARDAGLSRAHLIELLAQPLDGRIKELSEDVGASERSASIRGLNQVLALVQTQLASGEKFAEARAHFVEAFPRALAAYLGTIEHAEDRARTAVEESRKVEQVRVIQVGGPVNAIAVSPDGTILASGGVGGLIQLYNLRTGNLIKKLHQASTVQTLSFAPDGSRLASGAAVLRIWNMATLTEEDWPTSKGNVGALSFSPDGKYLALGDSKGFIYVIDSTSRKTISQWKAHGSKILSLKFRPDGRSIATGAVGSAIRIWNLVDGSILREVSDTRGFIFSLDFSPDGQAFVSGGRSEELSAWNPLDQEMQKRWVLPTSDWIRAVSFSPDGRYILIGNFTSGVRLVEAHSGRIVFSSKFPLGAVNSVLFTPDGANIISATALGNIRIEPLHYSFHSDAALLSQFESMRAAWLQDLREHPIKFKRPRERARGRTRSVGGR